MALMIAIKILLLEMSHPDTILKEYFLDLFDLLDMFKSYLN